MTTFPINISEQSLVEQFLFDLRDRCQHFLRSFATEFDYQSGRTDVVVLANDGEILAFEAKVTNWRKALHQAWRNTSYAQRAYVVMPRRTAAPALANLDQFRALGVGLCVVDEGGIIETALLSRSFEAVLPWLREKARVALEDRATYRTSRRRCRPRLPGQGVSAR